MHVLQLHNFYRWGGGEDDAVRTTMALLRRHGVTITEITRNSAAAANGVGARLMLAVQGLWSWTAYEEVREAIRTSRPDVAHVHNVYPMLSPSVLAACRDAGIPIVMTCHNYRLICPTAGAFRSGEVCTRCGGAGKELWCVARNCRGNAAESGAYALRSASARLTRAFTATIGRYIVPSRFAGTVLLRARVPANRIDVVPCMVPGPRSPSDAQTGEYIGFAGRLADEKGVGVLLRAAAMMPTVPFRIAGDGPLRNELSATAPPNVSFASHLEGDALSEFYRGARIVVVPSLWYETFGIVPAEAMSHQVPVVASRIGALEELVVDRVTGLLFDRGDAADLVRKLSALWPHPELCREMGRRGRAKIASECGEDSHATGLLASYRRAVFGHTRDARITGAA